MKIKSPINLILLLFLLSSVSLLAQPTNDNCANATEINDVSSFCSGSGAFTTVGATQSPEVEPSCWPNGSSANDVWFSFVAEGTDVNITVIGNTPGPFGQGGTIEDPQLALFSGDCSALTQLECNSDAFNTNTAETLAGPLTPGETYFIRVAARNGNTGTFQLCVNNFNAVPEPSGDCATGVVLCNKDAFTVPSVSGTGNDPNEITDASCIQVEHASTWYKWTCDVSGTLAFTLTPNKISDDLDFVVFELPNGIDDCSGKIELRCMASGENVDSDFSTWQPCTGATGLSLSSNDANEFPGCQTGDDNFVAAINMEAGKSYALIVDNFSESGNGFEIEFGGTGTFLGPDADFEVDEDVICLDGEATFTDASTSVTGIASWEWSFGGSANPGNATGDGPHSVSFDSPGSKAVVLQITSEAGCIVTHIENVTVLPQPDADFIASADYCDPNVATGSIIISPSGGEAPYQFDFNNSGILTSDSVFTDLEIGTYPVLVVDANGCERLVTAEIPEGLALDPTLDPVIPPTCNGDSDGQISVTVEIGLEPITYDFGNGPVLNNTLSNIPAGTYMVTVTDGIGCTGEFTIDVEDFPVLEPNIEGIDISCFGESDGVALVEPTGGAGNYTYQWNIPSTKDEIDNLVPGDYIVTVTDANGCMVVAQTPIVEPPELFLDLIDIEDVICFGDETGVITVEGSGGTPGFQYSIDGENFQDSPMLGNLGSGNYTIIVEDSRGCRESLQAAVNEPAPLTVDAGPDQTIELGEIVDLQAIHSPLFRPVTFSWTPTETILDCIDCDDPTVQPVGTTTYYVFIEDETMCRSQDSVTINVILNYPVHVPNVFSPNDDGVNDNFTLYAGPAARNIQELKVFSRWGSLVFEANNIPLNDETFGWDGTFNGEQMDPAVFVYFANVEFIDGSVFLFEGDVTLLR